MTMNAEFFLESKKSDETKSFFECITCRSAADLIQFCAIAIFLKKTQKIVQIHNVEIIELYSSAFLTKIPSNQLFH